MVLGPQGAGKGTQAAILARKHHLVHLEPGAMFRAIEARKHQTPLSRHIAGYVQRGSLVPFDFTLRLLTQRIAKLPRAQGIILDGAPRRMSEAHALIRALKKKFGRTIDLALLIVISHHESLVRLSKRWVCIRCKHALIMGKDVHRSSDHCPLCGGRIVQRDDDKPTAIKKRLHIFQHDTKPVVAYFRARRILHTVRGERHVTAIARDIEKAYATAS